MPEDHKRLEIQGLARRKKEGQLIVYKWPELYKLFSSLPEVSMLLRLLFFCYFMVYLLGVVGFLSRGVFC